MYFEKMRRRRMIIAMTVLWGMFTAFAFSGEEAAFISEIRLICREYHRPIGMEIANAIIANKLKSTI